MPFPLDKKTVPPVYVEGSGGGKYKKLYEEAEVQNSLLEGQLQQTQASLAQVQVELQQAQSDLAIAQAQVQQDAATIASLQAQVAGLQSQVASLQQQVADLEAQIASMGSPKPTVFFLGEVTLVGGGIELPPSFSDATITVSNAIIPARIMGQITTVGGGYP